MRIWKRLFWLALLCVGMIAALVSARPVSPWCLFCLLLLALGSLPCRSRKARHLRRGVLPAIRAPGLALLFALLSAASFAQAVAIPRQLKDISGLVASLASRPSLNEAQWRFVPPDLTHLSLWVSPRIAYSDTALTTRVTADGAAVAGLRDLSGNGFHAVQANAPDQPTLATGANGIGGQPALSFGGTKKLVTGSVFDSTYNTNFTFYIVMKWAQSGAIKVAASATGTKFYVGVNPAAGAAMYTATSQAGLSALTLSTNKPEEAIVVGFSYDGATSRLVTNATMASQAATGNLGLTNTLTIGDLSSGGNNFPGLVGDVLAYKAAHSLATLQATVRALARQYNLHLPLVTCDGNSLTSGFGLTTPLVEAYPAQLSSLLGSGWAVINWGVVAQTTPQMTADAAIQIDPAYNSLRTANICIVWEGTNDIFNGATAQATWDNLKAYCLARKAAGYKVILVTIVARNFTGFWTVADAANILMRAQWRQYAHALYDVAAYSQFQNAAWSNATWYQADGVHLKAQSYCLMARDLLPIIQSLALPSGVAMQGADFLERRRLASVPPLPPYRQEAVSPAILAQIESVMLTEAMSQ